MEATASLESALAYLTSSAVRNFYATVINTLERVAAPGLNTMAVAAHRGRYIMLFDPAFVEKIGFAELLATLEHEVLHIILHHIPRHLRLRTLFEGTEDLPLFQLCSNTASDLADNILLAENHPGVMDPAKPLGHWIIPSQFDPPLPDNLDYEKYHLILTALFRKRLVEDPSDLYKLAKKALAQQEKSLKDALNAAYPPPPPTDKDGAAPEKGEGSNPEGEGSGAPSDGSGAPSDGSGAPSDGSGAPSDGSGSGGTPTELELELDKLDPIDQLAVKLLMQSMAKHMAWDATADLNKKENQETDPHKLEEHGRQIIGEVVKNSKKTRGTIPSSASELIAKMLAPPTVSWTQLLYNLVQRTRQTKKTRGMARPSKKLAAFKTYATVEMAKDDDRDGSTTQ